MSSTTHSYLALAPTDSADPEVEAIDMHSSLHMLEDSTES
jgi:hypothetical protein